MLEAGGPGGHVPPQFLELGGHGGHHCIILLALIYIAGKGENVKSGHEK